MTSNPERPVNLSKNDAQLGTGSQPGEPVVMPRATWSAAVAPPPPPPAGPAGARFDGPPSAGPVSERADPPPVRRSAGEAAAGRPGQRILVVLAAGLVVAIAIVAVLLVGHRSTSHGPTGQTQAGPVLVDPGSSTPAGNSTVTSTTPSDTSPVSAPPVSAPPLTVPATRYYAPGGLSVQAPVGWRNDTSAGITNIRDYDAPDSPGRLLGQFFRIGIGNANPSSDFDDEVSQAANFLMQTYQAQIIQSPRFQEFHGVRSADIEYQYSIPSLGIERHGVERLWWDGGVTLIIQSSGLVNRWAAAQALFRQLVTSAVVG